MRMGASLQRIAGSWPGRHAGDASKQDRRLFDSAESEAISSSLPMKRHAETWRPLCSYA
jgi:hypothetical protein